MRRAVYFFAGCLALAGAAVLATGRAEAVSSIPFTLDVYNNGVLIGQSDQNALGCVDNPDGVSAHCAVQNIPYGPGYDAVTVDDLNMDIDKDPVVTGSMTVTNTQTTTQLYTFIFTLGVSPIPGSTLTGGSARGTITATNSTNAVISVGPDGAIYTPLIDGLPYGSPPSSTQLLFGPYSDAPGGGPTNIPSSAFGVTIPSYPGPSVASSIGIQLQFNLTAGDQASITSNHVVVVPEPQTAALLGVGLVLLAIRRR